MRKLTFILIGFITGAIYMVACGGGSGSSGITNSIAASIGNAIDVIFDNSESDMEATNVQAALEELSASIAQLTSQNNSVPSTESLISGNWGGSRYHNESCTRAKCKVDDLQINLATNKSLTCSGSEIADSQNFIATNSTLCLNGGQWELLKKVILFTDNTGAYKAYRISYISETDLELIDTDTGEILSLSK